MKKFLLLLLLFLLIACTNNNQQSPDKQVKQTDNHSSCRTIEQNGQHHYSVCSFTPEYLQTHLSLAWKDPQTDKPFYQFAPLNDWLKSQHKTLVFAMNAGMYDDNFAPIGLTVIDGKEIKSLNQKDGQGNFHLMPNGVFWGDKDGFYIDTTPDFANKMANITPQLATQSGPMLVIDGNIHPKFDPKSTSVKMRNGVGTGCVDGQIHFVISGTPMTFYEFAKIFQMDLSCQNALFLDGGVASALYAPSIERFDKHSMGVMLVVSE